MIKRQIPSKFFCDRPIGTVIDTVVLHSMYNPEVKDRCDVDSCIELLNRYKTSAHYLIDRKGQVTETVSEDKRASHAGVSRMPDGREGLNDFSIGIEVLCVEGEQFSAIQYTSLAELIAEISTRHPIKSVVGHSHVAMPPGRKSDPWINFNWITLVESLHKLGLKLDFPFL